MPGRPNKRWMETMIAKLGSREAVSADMSARGTKGGHNGNTGGFAVNRELARIAGAKGGRNSRRGKNKVQA